MPIPLALSSDPILARFETVAAAMAVPDAVDAFWYSATSQEIYHVAAYAAAEHPAAPPYECFLAKFLGEYERSLEAAQRAPEIDTMGMLGQVGAARDPALLAQLTRLYKARCDSFMCWLNDELCYALGLNNEDEFDAERVHSARRSFTRRSHGASYERGGPLVEEAICLYQELTDNLPVGHPFGWWPSPSPTPMAG